MTLSTMVTISSMMNIPTMITISTMMTTVSLRKLEVVNKEVGDFLISFNLKLGCVRKLEVVLPDARALPRRLLCIMNNESLSQSVRLICRYRAVRAAKNSLNVKLLAYWRN